MTINLKTGKDKGTVFILSPDHVLNELLERNGIEFYGKSLILEEAMSSGKKVNNNDKNSIIINLKLS